MRDEQPMTADRRRFTRVPFEIQARVHIDEKTVGVDKIRDISLGGCFIPVSAHQMGIEDSETALGRDCRIDITLTGTTTQLVVEMDARIVRSGPEGMAVTFTNVAPDSLFHLQNIIRYNASDADEIDEELQDHLKTDKTAP